MSQAIALATSIITLTGMWAAGSHKTWAWPVGLANQALWFAFIVAFGAWGLLPLNVALVVVYTRNWIKWAREAGGEDLETACPICVGGRGLPCTEHFA